MIIKLKTRKLLYFIVTVCLVVLTVVLILTFAHREDGFMDMNLEVTSTAFENNGTIPVEYTGKGKDISPPLEIKGIVSEGKTIAIIMDDPDAPMGVFTHWLIWNIPVKFNKISADVPKKEVVSSLEGACQGKNDFNKIGYNGPLPPSGIHTYRIKVYVLDTKFDLKLGDDKSVLQKVIEGHILQYGLLRGKFSH